MSDTTRDALLEAATTVFAEHGYIDGSVRLITRRAGANQAAITYHFGGKEGLYRAVLRAAMRAFEDQSLITEAEVLERDRRDALRLIMRQFLLPLTQQDRLGRYVRIFGRESVDPSAVYTSFFTEERPRIFGTLDRFVRRFLPEWVEARHVALTVFWLMQQPIAVVHHAGRLAAPPYDVAFDSDDTEELVEMLSDLSLGGLERRGTILAERGSVETPARNPSMLLDD